MPPPAGTKRAKRLSPLIRATNPSPRRTSHSSRGQRWMKSNLSANLRISCTTLPCAKEKVLTRCRACKYIGLSVRSTNLLSRCMRPPTDHSTLARPLSTVFGSIAEPLPPVEDAKRPAGLPPDHTHKWTVYVRGVADADVTHWLKKVSFKLHESFAQATRTIEAPEKFEVTETGWGEFEIAIRLFFVPEANEKPTPIYHFLKLHPYGDGADEQKAKGLPVRSETYTEIVFVEPLEPFYDILTGGGASAAAAAANHKGGGKGKNKGGAAAASKAKKEDDKRTAEIPMAPSPGNEFSMRTEEAELERLSQASKKVQDMIAEQLKINKDREEELKKLREDLDLPNKGK